jgi:hypothetical protein
VQHSDQVASFGEPCLFMEHKGYLEGDPLAPCGPSFLLQAVKERNQGISA